MNQKQIVGFNSLPSPDSSTWIERRPPKSQVEGSNPSRETMYKKLAKALQDLANNRIQNAIPTVITELQIAPEIEKFLEERNSYNKSIADVSFGEY